MKKINETNKLKNIIIDVLVVIIEVTVFFAQSQGAAALETKEQMEVQIEQREKMLEDQTNMLNLAMTEMRQRKMLADPLQLALNSCR